MRTSKDVRIFFSLNHAVSGLILWFLIVFTYLVYQPGITPGFLFDDFININDLGKYGEVDNWTTALQYILTADAGPTGRPISVASFLLNDNSWPSIATSFKYTNVLLHLLCGTVLAWLFYLTLVALRSTKESAAIISVAAAAIWLLHPYHVSTILYPVQRMTILSALFVILGLALYIKGRLTLIANESNKTAYAYMISGIAVCTPLALLSKENGGLLPLLALIIDITILRNLPVPFWQRNKLKGFKLVFLILPVIMMILYFYLNWQNKILSTYIFKREFSLTERLLTECRVLLDYLNYLLLPKMQSSGLYYDNYQISTNLFDPPGTIVAVISIFILLFIGISLRKMIPLLSVAILFFFSAHIIESTFLPLEIYFEHRNYLPSLYIPLAVVSLVCYMSKYATKCMHRQVQIQIVGILLIVICVGSLTYARVNLWSDFNKLGLVWAHENPGSVRSQQQAALTWNKLGAQKKAIEHIELGIKHNPENLQLHVQLLSLQCLRNNLSKEAKDKILAIADRNIMDEYVGQAIEAILLEKKDSRCSAVSYDFLNKLMGHLIANAEQFNYPATKEHAYYLNGQLKLYQHQYRASKKSFLQAIEVGVNPVETGLMSAAILATNHQYDYALEILGRLDDIQNKNSYRLNNNLLANIKELDKEVERLKSKIQKEIKLK